MNDELILFFQKKLLTFKTLVNEDASECDLYELGQYDLIEEITEFLLTKNESQ